MTLELGMPTSAGRSSSCAMDTWAISTSSILGGMTLRSIVRNYRSVYAADRIISVLAMFSAVYLLTYVLGVSLHWRHTILECPRSHGRTASRTQIWLPIAAACAA